MSECRALPRALATGLSVCGRGCPEQRSVADLTHKAEHSGVKIVILVLVWYKKAYIKVNLPEVLSEVGYTGGHAE